MSIRTKLIALVIGLLLAMLLLGVNGLMRMASIHAAFETTYNDRVVCLGQLKIVADAYSNQIVDTTQKLNYKAMDWSAGEAAIQNAKARITEQWKAYTDTFLTD